MLLLVGTFVSVPFVAGLGGRPLGAVALAAILLAQRPVTAVLSGARGPALIPVLVATGRVQLVFGGNVAAHELGHLGRARLIEQRAVAVLLVHAG